MDLIKVESGNGEQVVSARELHKKLEITERFNNWFERMLKFGFIENVDFTSVKSFAVVNNGARKEVDEYILKLDMAKQICMLQRSDLGTNFRLYFIECEKKLKEVPQPKLPATYLEALKELVVKEEALIETKEKVKNLECKIEEDRSKVNLANSINNSTDLILVRELAKIVSQNGIEMGEKKLFQWLRDNSFLIKKHGSDYNMPTQKAIELGVLRVVERTITNGTSTRLSKTSKITARGQEYFVNKLLASVPIV